MALAPSTGIAIVAKKRLDGSKPPPNVTRQKGRHNTRLRRGQQVGRVMIGLSHMARSDWRRRPSAMKWRPGCTNTTQFKRKNEAIQLRYGSFECYGRRTVVVPMAAPQSALCYRFTNQTPVRAAFLVRACAIASSRVSA